MDLEQQLDEIEALSSIYPDEFKKLEGEDLKKIQEEAGWTYEAINGGVLRLQPVEEPENVHVGIFLHCGMPAEYPISQPVMFHIEVVKGISRDQKKELGDLLQANAEENLGMPSIFSLASVALDWLNENNVEGQDDSMYADMMRRMQKKDVEHAREEKKKTLKQQADGETSGLSIDLEELERIRKRQAGVQVTVESFEVWKKKFIEEMNRNKPVKEVAKEKLTGKEWFIQNQGADFSEVDKLIEEGEAEEIDYENIELEDVEDGDDEDYDENEEEN